MRMGNPSVRRLIAKTNRGEMSIEIQPATYKGVYGKATLFAFLTVICAVVTELVVLPWALKIDPIRALTAVGIAAAVCTLPLIIMSIVIAFVPTTAKVLGIIYSVLQGGLLGCLGLFVDMFYPGIAFAAFLGTSIVFLISLAVNRLLEVRISSKFMRGIMVAFFSLMALELVVWLLSFTGIFGDFSALWWIQLVVSAVCIIWATIMLTWDLQNIDYLVKCGADKKYEWCVAFSLVTTLVYLYVEILELLLRFVMLFQRNKN